MSKFVNSSRIYAILGVIAVLLIIYVARLYALQLRGGADVDEVLANATTSRETVEAARGDLVDRNGTLLASTSVSYDVMLSRGTLLDLENRNDIILDIVYTAVENGVNYTDTFPVTMAAPFAYVSGMTGTQRSYLDAYFEFFDLDPDISASDLIVWMKDHYGIDYTTPLTDARLIIGVRYELELRVIVNIDSYVFAEDAGTEFVAILEEKDFPAVTISKSAKREYHTEYAAHLLGYLGMITSSQAEKYEALGYPMDAYVGQSGVEAAFEEYLHGVDGLQKVTRSESGSVISTEMLEEALPGNNVYLTIDIGVQRAAEEALADTIAAINATREDPGDHISGAAAAVVEVNTGETIALASYPTYDISSFLENYTTLINNPSNPVLNRATDNHYSPGSTFKMAVALAGMRAGQITRSTTVNDTGKYMEYASVGYAPVCWIYTNVGYGHGTLDIIGALRHSCNVFFYWVGDNIGIRAITKAAEDFGFGSSTGIEIGDIEGVVSSVEYKEEHFNEDWYAADTILASIGQGYNLFTPIQLANYAATIANGGTRYRVTLLNSVKSADYSEVVFKKTPEVAYRFTGADLDYISILQEGMKAVADSGGTAASAFANYEVDVAAKTGTVQSDKDVSNNGVFVCYAPADDPEIAVAVVVEKGGSGSAIMGVAKEILDSYFGGDVSVSVVTDGTLLR